MKKLKRMETYYNTTHLEGVELQERVEKAGSQEDRILDFFKDHPEQPFTPFEVMEKTGIDCINSVRRAITNLTQKGKLVKTTTKKIGHYGQKNYTWALFHDQISLF